MLCLHACLVHAGMYERLGARAANHVTLMPSLVHPLPILGDKKQLYAVVAIGGHQYRVQPGEILPIEKIPLQKGDEFVFDKVLMVADGDNVELGQPYVAGQKVKAEVLRNSAGKKIRIFKYNAKKHTRLTQGHRQKYTDIHITEVNGHRVDSKVDWADSDSETEPALA
jgi:large subunit ribosomal protein L21